MPISVDCILALPDDALLRDCRTEFYKSGGPGGQKRNKTSSAARITHLPTGVEAHSNDFRSQAQNRLRALHRLRYRIAAEVRGVVAVAGYQPPAFLASYKGAGRLQVNARNADYSRVAHHALDLLAATEGKFHQVATLLGVSTSSLVSCLQQEHIIWDAACQIRRRCGLPANPFPS